MARPPETRALALIGLRATGKTCAGRLLAARLALPFVDLDEELSRSGDLSPALRGRPAGEILAALGESEFREQEARALERALGRAGRSVIATGGGTVEREANRALLAREALCIWLVAEPEVLVARMQRDPTPRPALTGRDPLAEIRYLEARRGPWYAELAAARIDAGGGPPEAVVERILASGLAGGSLQGPAGSR